MGAVGRPARLSVHTHLGRGVSSALPARAGGALGAGAAGQPARLSVRTPLGRGAAARVMGGLHPCRAGCALGQGQRSRRPQQMIVGSRRKGTWGPGGFGSWGHARSWEGACVNKTFAPSPAQTDGNRPRTRPNLPTPTPNDVRPSLTHHAQTLHAFLPQFFPYHQPNTLSLHPATRPQGWDSL